jgi:hypothetical protein
MGWLFAVALAIAGALAVCRMESSTANCRGPPLSVGVIVALVAVIHATIPYQELRRIAAAVLIGFGVCWLVRQYPRLQNEQCFLDSLGYSPWTNAQVTFFQS